MTASILYRFPRYLDRVQYFNQTGNIAAAFDKNKRPKLWVDPGVSDADGLVQYKRLPVRGEPLALQTFTMTGADAAAVNLPGMASYPVYVVAPTVARILQSGQAPQTINLPEYLSTLQQAAQLQAEIHGDDVEFDNGLLIDYGTETRRMWAIRRGSALLNVGLLLEDKYNSAATAPPGLSLQRGVGSPGHWDLSQAQPIWVPDILDLGGLSNDLPEMDPPARELHPGESLVWGLTGLELVTAGQPAGPSQLPDNFQTRFAALEVAVADIRERLKKLGI